jgi:hypothetical protein
MIIGQWLAGVPMTAAEVVIFPALAGIAILMAFLLLRDLREDAPARSRLSAPQHRAATS